MPFDGIETRLTERLDEAELPLALMRARELPDYATEWERRAIAMPSGALEIETAIALLRTLHDPATCPAEWLFLLAWDLSVDVWDADWPERIKRGVCLVAWEVHRYKGTRFAIRRSLEALGLRVELVPWFEQEPLGPRGTFSATVYVHEQTYDGDPDLLSDRVQAKAREAITRTKPLTRHFDFRIGLDLSGPIATGSAATALGLARASGRAEPGMRRPGTLTTTGSAAAALGIARARGAARVAARRTGAAGRTGSAARALTIHRATGVMA